MKKTYKKGFSMAEMLVLFLLISTMLAAFSPMMTKRDKKEVDTDCPTGIKKYVIEYTIPGNYTFTAPENVGGDATITLVGGGGSGSNSQIVREGLNWTYYTGAGGGGGTYAKYSFQLTPNQSYTVVVGAGGTNLANAGNSSFGSTLFAQGGANANGTVQGQGGYASSGNNVIYSSQGQAGEAGQISNTTISAKQSKAGAGGGNTVFSTIEQLGGAAGDVCKYIGSCNQHGRPGRGYEENGASDLGYVAGTGGGGAGFDFKIGDGDTGYGAYGGGGYVKIEYQTRCNR